MKVGFNAAAGAYAEALRRGGAAAPSTPKPVQGFGDLVRNAAEATIGQVKAGEAMTLKAAVGKPDMTQVVTAVSNAEVTLQAAVAVRDKVIQAYLDIVRMPI